MRALLIGLVRSGERPDSRARASRSLEPWKPAEPVSLRVPIVPAPAEVAPARPSRPGPTEAAQATNEQRREPARLSGLVLRPEGDPASDARVVLGEQRARCTPDGRFELVLADGAAPADLLAFEPGYEPVLRPAVGAGLAAGATHELRLVLGPSTLSLTGTVTTRAGEPLAGWTVELDGLDPLATFGLRESVLTDAEGRFLLSDVPNGVHVVRAFAAQRELAFRSPPIAAGEEGLIVLADPGE